MNGAYSFTVDPGSYVVSEVLQDDWFQSYPASGVWNITLESAEIDAGNNFGNYQMATKSGTKFEDMDADGEAREAGEDGLEGWTIKLDGTDGMGVAVHMTDVTDANGEYSFSVKPGTYVVSEVGQAGWTQSYPADDVWNITLESGEVDSGNDFGNWAPATKSGYKWNDVDADGTWDAGELGMSGWTIQAWKGDTKVGETTHQQQRLLPVHRPQARHLHVQRGAEARLDAVLARHPAPTTRP